MTFLRTLSLALLLLPAMASAQWQWLDKDGRKVFSDRSPPADVPAKNILKQPGGKPVAAAAPEVVAAVPAAAASRPGAPRAGASAPKVSGVDKALEEKKKQADEAEAEKKKAEDEKLAKAKAENCERARRALAVVNSGERIRQPNAKGELEFISDQQKADEAKRLQGITADCKS
jgi:hypothetical protein